MGREGFRSAVEITEGREKRLNSFQRSGGDLNLTNNADNTNDDEDEYDEDSDEDSDG